MSTLNSVFSNKRTITTNIGTDIFKHTVMKFNHRYSMDGFIMLDNIKDNVIPVAFFDPQYRGVLDKLSYGNEGKRQIKRSELTQMNEQTITNFIQEIYRVMIPTGHLFLWVDKFHLCQGISSWIKNTKLQIVDMIVWDKQKMGMGYRSRRQSEYLIVLQKPPIKAKDVWKTRDIRDIWSEKIIKKTHPHQKPIELQKKLIEAVSNPKDIVLDVAAGSFSVLTSAIETNRLFLGTDISKDE
ncbi:site-specific DNA-methyltransferase [Mycoplasma mycoides subsp. capri]|uniref:DNA-methyltransferase n=1 Tax=Mycoplasma mycoides TaxID=2102 RepID=UPI00223F2186|nr:site-specific DNA-methyltransferase [Mycoplasma mycoides]UZK64366.1 site-specific DNA-methyltransferase [Mycoplasma mycoides subsp. capri]